MFTYNKLIIVLKYILAKHLYTDYGTKTCAGYPGSIDHIQQDMNVSELAVMFYINVPSRAW